MNLTVNELLVIFIAGILFSALFSMIEAAIISQDRHRLAHLADSGGRAAQLMQKMLGNMDRLLSAILLFNNIANVMCATAASVVVARFAGGGEGAVFAASLGVAFLILVMSEISPKIIGVRYAGTIALIFARPLQILLKIFYPIISIANLLARAVLAVAGIRNISGLRTAMDVSELKSAVRESNQHARDANDDKSERHYYMFEQLLRLSGMPVEKIMTPRRQIEGVNLQDGGLYEILMGAGRTKLPVFDGNIDATEGFIDTLQAIKIAAGERQITADMLRAIKTPPLFIPAAADALRQMDVLRRQSARIALVVDGAGRVTGLVTLSNFSAAVIGDEEPLDDIARTPEGDFMLPGDFPLMQLGDLHQHFSAPDTSASSINGLIVETLGGIPDAPVCLRIGKLRMAIVETDKTSVLRVRLMPPVE